MGCLRLTNGMLEAEKWQVSDWRGKCRLGRVFLQLSSTPGGVDTAANVVWDAFFSNFPRPWVTRRMWTSLCPPQGQVRDKSLSASGTSLCLPQVPPGQVSVCLKDSIRDKSLSASRTSLCLGWSRGFFNFPQPRVV